MASREEHPESAEAQDAARHFFEALERYEVMFEHPDGGWYDSLEQLVSAEDTGVVPARAYMKHDPGLEGVDFPLEKEGGRGSYGQKFQESDTYGDIYFSMNRENGWLFEARIHPPSVASWPVRRRLLQSIPDTDSVSISYGRDCRSPAVQLDYEEGDGTEEGYAAVQETVEVAQSIIERFAERAVESFRSAGVTQEAGR